jgi:hypothetical protein
LFYELIRNKLFRKAVFFVTIFILLLLGLSTINFYSKSYFFPADLRRISIVLGRYLEQNCEESSLKNEKSALSVSSKPNRARIFKGYLLNMTENRPAFYYSHLNYNKLKYCNIKHSLDTGKKLNKDFEHFRSRENESLNISEITKRVFSHHIYVDYSDSQIQSVIDYNYRPRNYMVFTSHGIYSAAYYIAYKYSVPSILFVFITIVSIIKLLSNFRIIETGYKF